MSLLQRSAFRLFVASRTQTLGVSRSYVSLSSRSQLQKPIRPLVCQPFSRRWLLTDDAESKVQVEGQGAAEVTSSDDVLGWTQENNENQSSEFGEKLDRYNDRAPRNGGRSRRNDNATEGYAGYKKLSFKEPPQFDPNPIVYVGNMFFDVKSDDLKKEFEAAGTVVSARVVEDFRGLSKGFGYVEFEDTETAVKAISMFNLQPYEGRRINVQFARPANSKDSPNRNQKTGPSEAPSRTLFVGNISFDLSDRELNDLFNELGASEVRVAIDRRTGQPRGFAHADFDTVEAATKALESLQDREVHGRRLRTDYTQTSQRANMSRMRNNARDESRGSME